METIFILSVLLSVLIFVTGRILEDKLMQIKDELTKITEKLNNIENKLNEKKLS